MATTIDSGETGPASKLAPETLTTALNTLYVSEPLIPPPGSGLKTLTAALIGLVKSPAGMAAVLLSLGYLESYPGRQWNC